jgi:hypothetical protein
MKQQILTQDETIAEITAKHQANAELEIEKFKLSFEVEDARNTLTGKFYSQHDLIDSELSKVTKALHDEHTKAAKALYATQAIQIKDFESKYGVPFLNEPAKAKATTNEKCKYVAQLKDKTGALKYTYNGKNVVGVKGNPITSTIVYKDADGAKQTLNVGTFQTHLSYLA